MATTQSAALAKAKSDYAAAQKRNDYAGMINAAKAGDAARVASGQAAQNTSHIAGLTTARNEKIANMNKPTSNAQSTPSTGAVGTSVTPQQTYTDPIYQPTTQPVTQPQYDPTPQINALAEAQKTQTIANLDKARQTGLSNLDKEKSAIQPKFYDARNQSNVTMNNAQRSWSDYLAQRGLNSSGLAAQGAMNTFNQYQGDIGSLNRQEKQNYADIERSRSDLNNAYETDVASANAGIEANRMDKLIESQQNAEEINYNRNQDALKNSIDTVGAYYNDYQAEINRRMTANPNDPLIPYLQMARQQKLEQEKASKEAERVAKSKAESETQSAQIKYAQDLWNNALDLWKIRGIADSNISSILGVPAGSKTADYNLASIKSNYDANKPYYAPAKSSSSSSSSSATTNKNALSKTNIIDYINRSFKTDTGIDQGKVRQYLQQLKDSNSANSSTLSSVKSLYGITGTLSDKTTSEIYNDFVSREGRTPEKWISDAKSYGLPISQVGQTIANTFGNSDYTEKLLKLMENTYK